MRPKNPKKCRLLLRLAAVAAVLVFLLWQGERNLTRLTLSLADARARALAVTALNTAADEVLSAGTSYEQLMLVSRDDKGQVRLIQANTQALNLLATSVSLAAQARLEALESQTVSVPLGSVLGLTLLAGMGPVLQVHILPVGTVVSSIKTDFQTAGINQTRHRVILTLRADVRLVIPTGSAVVSAVTEVAAAESIIVGDVPSSFVDVSSREDMLNLIP